MNAYTNIASIAMAALVILLLAVLVSVAWYAARCLAAKTVREQAQAELLDAQAASVEVQAQDARASVDMKNAQTELIMVEAIVQMQTRNIINPRRARLMIQNTTSYDLGETEPEGDLPQQTTRSNAVPGMSTDRQCRGNAC